MTCKNVHVATVYRLGGVRMTDGRTETYFVFYGINIGKKIKWIHLGSLERLNKITAYNYIYILTFTVTGLQII